MEEPKQEYFKKSLSDFTFDMASGGAIRHLADRGYTVEQIVKMLDFPTPYDRVQQTVWKYFLDKGTVLLKEPEREAEEEKYGYVTDYDVWKKKLPKGGCKGEKFRDNPMEGKPVWSDGQQKAFGFPGKKIHGKRRGFFLCVL